MEPGAPDSDSEGQSLSPHFMELDGSIYLFGSNPILMTNWSGPARGVIIIGVDFAKRLKQISETLGNPCEFLPVPSQRYPDRWSKSVAVEESAEGQALVWQSRGAVIGVDTSYALMIRASRDIYNQGKKAVYKEVYSLPEMFDLMRPKYEAAKKRTAAASGNGLKRGVGVALGR